MVKGDDCMKKKGLKIASNIFLLGVLSFGVLEGCSKISGSEEVNQPKQQKESKKVQQVVLQEAQNSPESSQPKDSKKVQQEVLQETQNSPESSQPKKVNDQPHENKPTENVLKVTDEKGVVYATAYFPKTFDAYFNLNYNNVESEYVQNIYVVKDGIDYYMGSILICDKSKEEYYKGSLNTLLKEVKGKLLYSQFPSEIPQNIIDLNDQEKIDYFKDVHNQLVQIVSNMKYEQ